VRIFKEITDSIGMEAFNSQLQEYLERGLRGVATEALLQKGGVESLPAGGSKATMGMLRGDLEQLKQLQQDTQQQQQVQAVATQQQVQAIATQQQVQAVATQQQVQAVATQQQVQAVATQQQVQAVATQQQETKQEVQETKRELTVLSALQEETKQEMQQRMSTIERKLDVLLELLAGGVAASPAAARATEDRNTQ
jgi:hypothetical protein